MFQHFSILSKVVGKVPSSLKVISGKAKFLNLGGDNS
jgi:hypothetical protein